MSGTGMKITLAHYFAVVNNSIHRHNDKNIVLTTKWGFVFETHLFWLQSFRKHVKATHQTNTLLVDYSSCPWFCVTFFTLVEWSQQKHIFLTDLPHLREGVTRATHVPRQTFNSMFNFQMYIARNTRLEKHIHQVLSRNRTSENSKSGTKRKRLTTALWIYSGRAMQKYILKYVHSGERYGWVGLEERTIFVSSGQYIVELPISSRTRKGSPTWWQSKKAPLKFSNPYLVSQQIHPNARFLLESRRPQRHPLVPTLVKVQVVEEHLLVIFLLVVESRENAFRFDDLRAGTMYRKSELGRACSRACRKCTIILHTQQLSRNLVFGSPSACNFFEHW